MSMTTGESHVHGRYRHEALFYRDNDEFMDGVLGFIRDALVKREPMLVVLSAQKITALRHELASVQTEHDDCVVLADMADVGANPARIIPAWQAFVALHAGPSGRIRGIGEPIWAERSPAELAECQRHEALLNAAFDDPDFWLLCPYDTQRLSASVLAEAERNHPYVQDRRCTRMSTAFPGLDALVSPFDEPLSPVPPHARTQRASEANLRSLRRFVIEFARSEGMTESRAADLAVGTHEVAVNAVFHGAGRGAVWLWHEDDAVVCEVRSRGEIGADPLVDRRSPPSDANRGRGLWLANQLCDLVQIRSLGGEVVVRLRLRIA